MKQIHITKVQPDTIYGYYQTRGKTRWLAFVKYVSNMDDTYTFIDICDCYILRMRTVRILTQSDPFEVTVKRDHDDIIFFQLTEDEILKHVIMENI